MSKCKKVKNPCKICLASVTRKTGLQCQGACECWVHYTCLNYTPGKIKDIKAGVLKITCPCPDCKPTLPREQHTDEPFNCSNLKCPVNRPPRCGNIACPSNTDALEKMNQTSVVNAPHPTKSGAECKTHSHSNIAESPGAPTLHPYHHHPGAPSPHAKKQHTPPDSLLSTSVCPSRYSSLTDIPGNYRQSPMEGLPSLRALEQMCNTVGQLTNQINRLMNKMRHAVEERSRVGGCGGNRKVCSQKGPKSMCPKPCYCPGNPGRN